MLNSSTYDTVKKTLKLFMAKPLTFKTAFG